MPRQDEDITGEWTISGTGQTWTLTENTVIHGLQEGDGIIDEGSDNAFRIMGVVQGGDPDDGWGIGLGEGSFVYVGETGAIGGFDVAIFAAERGTKIENRGLIEGNYAISLVSGTVENFGTIMSNGASSIGPGVTSAKSLRLMNDGTISGKIAVWGQQNGTVFNGEDATITGQLSAIELGSDDGKVNTIENYGLVRGRVYAINSAGETNIVNHGTIFGDIELGSHDDRIDIRDGVFKGTLYGGEGDDTYLVSSPFTKIDDKGASFNDIVKSTQSFKLTGGLDHLYLLGNKSVSADGNAGDNRLYGNKAINNLYGLEGDDTLSGEGGNDLLVGGTGEDQFWFFKGFDVDTIEDFEDGLDRIILSEAWLKIPFGKLDIDQKGDDVVIDFGHGDRLILQDFDKDNLTRADFGAAT